MEIRKVKKEEMTKVYEMRKYSFYDWNDDKPTNEELEYFTPDEFTGLFDNNELLSVLRTYNFRQVIRGTVKKMGGIATVCTPPEHRLKGYVKKLMLETFKNMKDNKQVVSMLSPFKESFYYNFDYVTTNGIIDIKIPIMSFNHYFDIVKNIKGNWIEERLKAINVKEELDKFKLEVVPSRYHGMILLNDVSEGVWKKRNKDNVAIIIKKNDIVEAIAIYSKKGFAEDGILDVFEMYWRSIEGRIRLFHYFAKHKDQTYKIGLKIPYGYNFHNWLKDVNDKFDVTIYTRTMMVRIIEVENALNKVPVNIKAECIVEIDDKYCKWNNEIFKIFTGNEKLKVKKISAFPDAKMDIKALSSLLYGTQSVEELEFNKLIYIINDEAREVLKEFFPVIPLFNTYHF